MAQLDEKDLRIDVFRNGTGNSAAKITHLPTGKSVECSKHRSHHKNIAEAREALEKELAT